MSGNATQRSALYASAGKRLIHFEVDAARGELHERATVLLPADVQYAWPHASGRVLYAACSDGNPDSGGSTHFLCALAIDASGALSLLGAPVSLRWRPLHITTDIDSAYAVVSYNIPSAVSVHRLNADGTIAAEVAQNASLDCGIYAHQVRFSASNTRAILVTRGNNPAGDKAEDPGALKVLEFREGQLKNAASIAPGGGYGFGPRHVDFHPQRPWLFVSLERQNTLQVYDFANEMPGAVPLHTVDTLADRRHHCAAQGAGTLHVHPNGRYVYVANRARASRELDGRRVFAGGENNIAVYAIDPASGKPALLQHADIRGIAPRTFAIDAGGRLLVAANLMPMLVAGEGGVTRVEAGLTVFSIGDDGRLTFVRKYDIDTGDGQLFWMGFVGLL